MKSPMLACKFSEEKVRPHLPLYAQPKLDGIRVFIRDGVAYTRSLKPIRNRAFQERVSEDRELLEGFDGEVIAGPLTALDAYRRTSSSLMSFNKGWDDFTFHVFDLINTELPFHKRSRNVMWTQFSNRPSWVSLLPTNLVHTIEEIYEYEQRLLSEGHEGVILRNPDSFYKFGRSSPGLCELVKLKRFEDTEGVILGYEELFSNQNEAVINKLGHTERSGHQENLVPMGVLGSLIIQGSWPSGETFVVRVGSGFTAEQREFLWQKRESLLGKFIKFKYFASGVKDAPRFPIFLGFRDEEDM